LPGCSRIQRFTSSVAAPRRALKYLLNPPHGAIVTATTRIPFAPAAWYIQSRSASTFAGVRPAVSSL
jgi:hypothetical protein